MSAGALAMDLSGVGVVLDGVTDDLRQGFEDGWAGFVVSGSAPAGLRLELRFDDRPAGSGPFAPKQMVADVSQRRAAYRMAGGAIELDDSGRGCLTLSRNLGREEYYTATNLVRAALAWRLLRLGGLMLHAAGLVLDERAFVLVGAEGAGKSTWARHGQQGGGRVLSDDIVLLMTHADGAADALGSPLRSTHRADYRPGRWPLAAALFPRWGEAPALAPASRLIGRARVLANMPFVAEGLESDPAVTRVVDRLLAHLPCLELTFDPSARFTEVLRGWQPGSR